MPWFIANENPEYAMKPGDTVVLKSAPKGAEDIMWAECVVNGDQYGVAVLEPSGPHLEDHVEQSFSGRVASLEPAIAVEPSQLPRIRVNVE